MTSSISVRNATIISIRSEDGIFAPLPLTLHIGDVYDGILILNVFNDAPDEPLRAFGCCVYRDEPVRLIRHGGCSRRSVYATVSADALIRHRPVNGSPIEVLVIAPGHTDTAEPMSGRYSDYAFSCTNIL